MLILSAGELQIRPNGEKRSVPSGQKSCKSVQILQICSAPKGQKTVVDCFLIQNCALEMLILRTGELQIRPNVWWLVDF